MVEKRRKTVRDGEVMLRFPISEDLHSKYSVLAGVGRVPITALYRLALKEWGEERYRELMVDMLNVYMEKEG